VWTLRVPAKARKYKDGPAAILRAKSGHQNDNSFLLRFVASLESVCYGAEVGEISPELRG